MPKIRPASETQRMALLRATMALRTALDELDTADCPQSKKKVRSALKSAEGALRHMHRRLYETQTPALFNLTGPARSA